MRRCAARATRANYEALLNTWVGAPADALVRSWGPPTSSYRLSNGNQLLLYERQSHSVYTTPIQAYQAPGYFAGNMYFPGATTVTGGQAINISRLCRTQFASGSDGRILSWKYEGNACVAKPPK